VSVRNIEQFQKLMLQDVAIQDKLKEASNLESFAKLAVQLGKQAGYHFTVEDVKAISIRKPEGTQTTKPVETITMPILVPWLPLPMTQAMSV
jgi:predicted component of type VI protein secretion system